MIKEHWSKVEGGAFGGLMMAVIYGLTRPGLKAGFWFDEAVTARGSQLSIAQMLVWAARYDSDLPLPYLVYRLGGLFLGWDEPTLRFISLLFTAGALTLLFWQWRQRWGRRAWLVGLAALLPAFYWPAGEVRYYALLFAAILFSHIQSIHFVERPDSSGWRVVLAWLGPVLVYPLGAVVSLWHGLFVTFYLFRQKRWQQALTCLVGAGVLMALLTGPFLIDDIGRQSYWPGNLAGWAVVQEMAGFLLSGSYLQAGWWPMVVVIGLSGLALWFFIGQITVQLALGTLAAGWATLLLLMLARPVFQVRYTLPLLASWLILWLALLLIPPKGKGRPWLAPAGALLAFAGMVYFGQTAIGYPNRDVQLREAAQWVADMADPADVIVAWPPDMSNALAYYLPGRITNWGPPGIWAVQNMATFESTWAKMMADASRPVWIINVTAYASHDPAQLLQSVLELDEAQVTTQKVFNQVEIWRAELKESPRPGLVYPFERDLINGPHLAQITLPSDTWCLNHPRPIYVWWRRLANTIPEYDFRVSVRLTANLDDLTPLAQQDGSPIPEAGNVTYFADWWPAERIEIGRFALHPTQPGRQQLILITYQEQGDSFTVLEIIPITEIVIQACAE